MSPCSKQQGVLNSKCLGLYATRQLIWRQMTKLFITMFTEIKQNTVDSPYIDSCLNLSTQRLLSSVLKAKVAIVERFNCMLL